MGRIFIEEIARVRKLQALRASLERIHALICVLALMILSLLRRKLEQAGISLSIAEHDRTAFTPVLAIRR